MDVANALLCIIFWTGFADKDKQKACPANRASFKHKRRIKVCMLYTGDRMKVTLKGYF